MTETNFLTDDREADDAAKEAVLTKATLRAASHLGLSNRVLGKILGLSEATVSRLRSGARKIEHDHKSFEVAALFVRFYRGLDAIVGSDDTIASKWLANHNVALGNRPINMIQSLPGLMTVIQYVDARRAII